mmetsp:Transcript_36678/g.105599  ORF Transcript_36678/g.105599 Transcript_36678/m.105599 type:complete len:334 (+) Transcript_36678:1792-2793(+)
MFPSAAFVPTRRRDCLRRRPATAAEELRPAVRRRRVTGRRRAAAARGAEPVDDAGVASRRCRFRLGGLEGHRAAIPALIEGPGCSAVAISGSARPKAPMRRAVVWLSVDAEALLCVRVKVALVHETLWPSEAPDAVHLGVEPLATVAPPAGAPIRAGAANVVAAPLALEPRAIGPRVDAMPALHAQQECALVASPVGEGLDTPPVLHVVAELADILRAVHTSVDAFAMGHAAEPLADVHVAVGMPQLPSPRGQALLPFAAIYGAVFPHLHAEAGTAAGVGDCRAWRGRQDGEVLVGLFHWRIGGRVRGWRSAVSLHAPAPPGARDRAAGDRAT